MTDSTRALVHDVNDRRSIFAAAVMAGGGAMCFVSAPLFIGEAMEGLGLGSDQAGVMFSSYLAGFTLICLTAVLWIRRLDWRLIAALAYAALAVGLAGAATAAGYQLLLAGFFVAGCGAGTLYGLAICMIGDTREPDRFFGVKVFGEQMVGVVLVFTLPITVQPIWGFKGLCFATAALAIVLGLTTLWVPPAGTKSTEAARALDEQSGHHVAAAWPVLIGVLGMLLFFGGLTVLWAFVERIADSRGLEGATVGTALSFAALGGGLGGLTAALVGDRFGRFKPLVFAIVGTAAVYAVYNLQFNALMFIGASFAYVFLWNVSLAYQFGIVSSADVSGRYAVLMSAALAMGGSLGSGLGGFILQDRGFGTLSVVSLGIAFLSLIIFFGLLRWLRREGLGAG